MRKSKEEEQVLVTGKRGLRITVDEFFDIKRLPNETTVRTFEDTDNNKNIVKCKDMDDLFNKLRI